MAGIFVQARTGKSLPLRTLDVARSLEKLPGKVGIRNVEQLMYCTVKVGKEQSR